LKILLDLSVSRISKVQLLDGIKTVDELTGERPLFLIDKILKRNHLKFKDLDEVDSYLGPGSFTGLKVGATVANILNWQLGKEKVIRPIYETKDKELRN
jgi:tRNA A37 threonylcarbamoyladenosine modification protein TsaB